MTNPNKGRIRTYLSEIIGAVAIGFIILAIIWVALYWGNNYAIY